MKNFSLALAGIHIGLFFEGVDGVPDIFDAFEEKNGEGEGLNIYFNMRDELDLTEEVFGGRIDGSMETTSAGKYYISFDHEKNAVSCSFEESVPLHFIVDMAVTRSFYTFQERLGLVIMHSASIEIDGDASLFIAPSGGGKSTIAALASERGMPVIGDDSIIIVKRRGDFYAGVFPASIFSDGGNEMRRVKAAYILNRAGSNRIRKMAVSEVMGAMMREAFIFCNTGLSRGEIIKLRKHVFAFLNDLLENVNTGAIDFDKSGDIFTCIKKT